MATSVTTQAPSDLGITTSQDASGKATWCIQVVVDSSTGETRKASYDATTSTWRLETDKNASNYCTDNSHPVTIPRKRRPSLTPPEKSSLIDSLHWTDALPPSQHVSFFRATDWTATALGPFDSWEHALRLYVHMLFFDSRAGIIWWGPKRLAIYNDALIPFLGHLHPTLMGAQFDIAIPETYAQFESVFHAMEKDQQIPPKSGLEVPLERHGYLEETWWDATMIPLQRDDGVFGGAYFSWLDVTRTVLRDRRIELVARLGRNNSSLNSISVWQHFYDCLAESPRDIPMAIIYAVDNLDYGDQRMHRKRSIGIGQAYTAAPPVLDLSSSEENDLAALFRSACDVTTDYIVLDQSTQTVPQSITAKVDWCGHGDPSRHFVIIRLQVQSSVRGFVMLGLNPRTAFDADHETFVTDLARTLRSLLARVVISEESQKREALLKQELTDRKRRISRMAEEVPVGIYDLAADGSMLWANTYFFDVMGVPPDRRDPAIFDWRDYISPEDQEQANMEMGRCLMQKVKISDTLRLRRRWHPPVTPRQAQPAEEPFWVLYSASPDLAPDGSVRSLMGCITDISHLKWAEQLQVRIADAAEMEKKKQEEFIDITSHEIRNPLSAITQCADSIIASFHDIQESSDARSLTEIIKQNVEDAESILFCTVHQRRIINDILTLGKLDSGLLTVAPISFHPQTLVDEAMQMFKAEFDANKIDTRVVIDEASVLGGSSSVRGDCARMMQILVNLLTNAIKFTRTEKKRNIIIRSGASYDTPAENIFGKDFQWNATEATRPDLTRDTEYGTGPDVYLYYSVTDSGKGIPGKFAHRVFSKFEQADRRTHTKYGGSGLGLFISRELTELQGGRIGVESKEAKGSTFAFYTKAKCEQTVQANAIAAKMSRPLANRRLTDETEIQKMENDSLYQTLQRTPRPVEPRNNNYEILLVEDNILNQKVLSKQLQKAGCVVHVANDGEEAVQFVLQSVPQSSRGRYSVPDFSVTVDCILMDWEMPVCDGLTATKRIREVETQHNIARNVIIGITANARPEQQTKAMEAGMDSIVPKPFRVPELLVKIREQVQQSYQEAQRE